jgi:dTDP-4-amino-4,6-dideoxygalactose transaminase
MAEAAYERLITLPIFPAMTDADVDAMISAVCKVVPSYSITKRA